LDSHSFLIRSASEARSVVGDEILGEVGEGKIGMAVSTNASCWLRVRVGRRPICRRAASRLSWASALVGGDGTDGATLRVARGANLFVIEKTMDFDFDLGRSDSWGCGVGVLESE